MQFVGGCFIRWYRRDAPQPPANGYEASGFANHSGRIHVGFQPERMRIGIHPGGIPAISRGLREFRAPTPGSRARNPPDPGGIADQYTIST